MFLDVLWDFINVREWYNKKMVFLEFRGLGYCMFVEINFKEIINIKDL